MKQTWKPLLLSSALACAPGLALAAPVGGTNAGFFTGPYVGAQVGLNDTSPDHGESEMAFTVGPRLGYNIGVPLSGTRLHQLVLGADVFAEFNDDVDHGPFNYGTNVYGVDFLAGLPIGAQNRLMPYVKLGFGDVNGTGDADFDDTGIRAGLGGEYALQRNLGITAEWMHQDADHLTNNNFTLGLNYHFGIY